MFARQRLWHMGVVAPETSSSFSAKQQLPDLCLQGAVELCPSVASLRPQDDHMICTAFDTWGAAGDGTRGRRGAPGGLRVAGV